MRCLHSNLLINHRHISCLGKLLHPSYYLFLCAFSAWIYFSQVVYWYATITQIQQQLQQTRVRAAREIERVTTELVREKEQIQLQLDTRTEELQYLRTEKEQLQQELQTARNESQQQIRQLQQQVSDIIVTSLYKSCEYSFHPISCQSWW